MRLHVALTMRPSFVCQNRMGHGDINTFQNISYNIFIFSRMQIQLSKVLYSSLDLTSGFWQLALEETARQLTAFTIPGRGRFHWLTTPMGLHGSPSSFARLMDYVMRDVLGVLTYIDDILVHSDSQQKQLTILEECFRRLRKHNLKLNIHKCKFAVDEVPYLGFLLTKDGVKPNLATH